MQIVYLLCSTQPLKTHFPRFPPPPNQGHFVPAISFGPSVICNLRTHFPSVLFDCHMMVAEPENFVEEVASDTLALVNLRSRTLVDALLTPMARAHQCRLEMAPV